MFYKVIQDECIQRIGIGHDGVTITESEYNAILTVIQNKPERTETTDYRLKTDLTWEAYTIEPAPEPDPDAEEALSILLGGEAE